MSDLSQSDYERLAAFRYALRRFQRFSEDRAIAAGIPPQQHQALLVIRGFPGGPMTVGALAEWLQIEPHSAVGLVNRMVKEDMLLKHRGARDRRQMELTLTARGEETLRQLSAAHRAELRRLAPELQQLLESLTGR